MKNQKNIKQLKTNYNFINKKDSLLKNNSEDQAFKLNNDSNYLKISNEINSLSEETEIGNNEFNFNPNFQDSKNKNIFDIKEIVFKLLKNDESFKIEQLNYFIINEQKQVNYEYDLPKERNSKNKRYKLKKLESLIAKYCIIIYYYIQKNNLIKAKNLLLLMIQENIKHLNYHTFKLFKIFTKLLQKFEIITAYPKSIKELLKIYSILIKYCSLFNLTIYKNMFLVRYLSLHSLNFKIFKRKFEIRGFKAEIKNDLKYLFSICLHYASFFSIKYLCPLKVPIKLSELILKVFRNLDDNISTKKEQSLIINTLFNQSIFYYLNNQVDSALRNLRLAKQKIISYHNKEKILNNIYNKFTRIVDYNKMNEKNNPEKLDSKKISFLTNLYNEAYSKENSTNKNQKEFSLNFFRNLEQIILSDNTRKKNLKLEDLIDLFDLNDNAFKIKNSVKKSTTMSIGASKMKRLIKYQQELSNIPDYLNEPLLLDIEIFMTEIEIDRKNYYMSYEHIKNSLILFLFLKKFGKLNNKEIQKRLNMISIFLEEVQKNNENKTLLSRIKSLQNFKIILNEEKLDKLIEINNNEKDIIISNFMLNINDEIEKLFLFLNSLSFYQIKLLNDTQPKEDTRNDIPIFFSNQFKHSLSNEQRNTLDKINIMSINRSSLLLNPNQSILPYNLNLKYSEEKINKLTKNKKDKIIKLNFDGSLMNNNLQSFIEVKTENFDIFARNELNNLKIILLATKKNNNLKSFLLHNIYFVHKIIKNSNDDMINEMIKNPEIIIETIKLYKKENQFDKNIEIIQKEMIQKLLENPQFDFLIKCEENLSDKEIILDNSSDEKNSNPISIGNYSFNISISSEEKIPSN